MSEVEKLFAQGLVQEEIRQRLESAIGSRIPMKVSKSHTDTRIPADVENITA